MAPTSCFVDDPYVTYIRECIVLPADGAEPHLVAMAIRTVTEDDLNNVKVFNRTVDLLAQYGSEYRKIRLATCPEEYSPAGSEHILHYNLSPKLPLNRCVARIVGINPDEIRCRLFWRGDVVVMSMKPEPRRSFYIIGQNAELSVVSGLAEMLRDSYSKGDLERELALDEQQWKYVRQMYPSFVTFATLYHPFWGYNWRKKEADFLNDMNELREILGRDPIILDTLVPGWLSDLLVMGRRAIQGALPSFFPYYRPIDGPPVLPPELERQIFEIFARNSRPNCLKLILVAHRVRSWIDPILFETVVLDGFAKSLTSSSNKFKLFMANIGNRPSEFYSEHVRNLWISSHDDLGAFDRILTICSGVENLVLFPGSGINLPFVPSLEPPNAGSRLRRLTCKLEIFFLHWSEPTTINFYHPCFANLTHLHLYDESEEWSEYTGFEHLRSLTHLALACCGPEELASITPKLPVLQYVAICSYENNEYCWPTVNRRIPMDVYGYKAVLLDGVTMKDWQRGAAGEGDFWDIVKVEVDRRLISMRQPEVN